MTRANDVKKRLKGFFCPECYGQRLHVITVARKLPMLIVRYRTCTACDYSIRTEERQTPKREKAPKRKKKFAKLAAR